MIVPIPKDFWPYVDPALVRLRYLYPKAVFAVENAGECIRAEITDSVDEDTLRREIHYALYREKIYTETLPLRRSLMKAVTQR